jgi:nicotinate-nucleotide adenylyltransferase
VREKMGLEKMFFIPSGNPPLKSSDIAPAADRHEMTRIATASNHFFEVSDIECRQQKKSYTVNTLRVLRGMYPGTGICLVLGIDSFLEIPTWHQHMKLLEEASFVVISRPGRTFSSLSGMLRADYGMLAALDASSADVLPARIEGGKDAVLLNVTPFHISATMIRALLREGKSIKYLLPEAVESYIISHNLFLEGSGSLRK